MTYLLKTEKDKTHHFRVAIEEQIISVVEGVFYEWMNKWSQNCGDNADAVIKADELANEKLKEGFAVMEFKESPENTLDVYDKAKWHFGGNFPEDLDIFQGYVHTGMFVGWLIDNDLMSEEYMQDCVFTEQFKKRELTGPQLFEKCGDGVLMLEDISHLGNQFALEYFNFDIGQYLNDYEITLGQNLPSLYYVKDSWENYNKIKQVIDKRFEEWKAKK